MIVVELKYADINFCYWDDAFTVGIATAQCSSGVSCFTLRGRWKLPGFLSPGLNELFAPRALFDKKGDDAGRESAGLDAYDAALTSE